MIFNKMKAFGLVMFSGLLCGGSGVAPVAASVNIGAEQGTFLSLHQRVDKSFDCGVSTVYIEENASGYSYQAINARGDELVIDGGTAHTGRNYSIIYVFFNEGTEFILEDYGNGRADLSIGSYPQEKMNYSCVE
ncbi:MAG: hypothetical protein WBG38_07135 [Nodosilinea sp.]